MNGFLNSHTGRMAATASFLTGLLALTVWVQAADTPREAPTPASKYAAKQVRLPEEKTAKSADERANAASASKSNPVRPVAHQQMVARPMTKQPQMRTASRTQGRSMQGRMVKMQDGAMMPMGNEMLPAPMNMSSKPGEFVPTPQGEVIEGEMGEYIGEGEGYDDGSGCCGDNCGGDCCFDGCGGCNNYCFFPCLPRFGFDRFEFFAGAEAFTGPLTRGEGGCFGFHEGLNWGSGGLCQSAISAQLGFMATQSTFSGNNFTDEERRQYFVTGGFFRRVDWGLQGGAVVDYQHDEWYYDSLNLIQVRAELSWVFPCGHEIGAFVTQGIGDGSTVATVPVNNETRTFTENWRPNDLYAFFYRRQFETCGASGRVFAGFTEDSDGYIGADFNVPISEHWALRSDFAYLVPTEERSAPGNIEESWNVGLALVWYPGCRTARSHDYNRPLFNVANNGTFMVDRNTD